MQQSVDGGETWVLARDPSVGDWKRWWRGRECEHEWEAGACSAWAVSVRRTWEFRKGGRKQRPAAEEKLAPFLNMKMAGPKMVHQKLNVKWTREQCTTLKNTQKRHSCKCGRCWRGRDDGGRYSSGMRGTASCPWVVPESARQGWLHLSANRGIDSSH